MRVLYVSQNGMGDNLGQSQVLPYLRGLARLGAEIHLLSFELSTLSAQARNEISETLARENIAWSTLPRRATGSLPQRFGEAAGGALSALCVALHHRPDIVHGRSYFATAICDAVAEVMRRPALLFDCRGMLGDEYVDAGHWTPDRLEYRLLKAYERRLFRRSDGIVVLTRALATWLRGQAAIGARPHLEVIPCCVDIEKYRPLIDARARLRRELGFDDALVLIYSGSLGSWYLEEEMARFAAAVREQCLSTTIDAPSHGDLAWSKRVVVACFTPSDASRFIAALSCHGFPQQDVAVRRVPPSSMPEHLSAGDIGLSFIKPCFSKIGSSPTKVAEYLACGNVVVTNVDIGDQADLAVERDACVGLRGFSEEELQSAAQSAVALAKRPWIARSSAALEVARRHFGLEEVGVPRYAHLYDALNGTR